MTTESESPVRQSEIDPRAAYIKPADAKSSVSELVERDDLASRLIGRADFCFDRAEVKTPALMRQAADEISRLRSALADAERERDELRAAKWKQQHVDRHTMNDMASLRIALEAAEDKLAEAVKVIDLMTEVVSYDATMEGPRISGVNGSAAKRADKAARAFIASIKGGEDAEA